MRFVGLNTNQNMHLLLTYIKNDVRHPRGSINQRFHLLPDTLVIITTVTIVIISAKVNVVNWRKLSNHFVCPSACVCTAQ